MNFDEALFYLLSLGHETLTIKLGLKNTETLLSALDHPHKKFRSVQIAGTNGKGSTAVMLDSICRAAGICTGLFTSPHLVSITERIQIDGRPISENDFARFTTEVKEIADQSVAEGRLETMPTFFEHLTAIALLAFGDARVEVGILETGLGGRLDSTSAAGAEIVAITPIAMDHEEYLGNTLAEIAAEKAAIIRPGRAAIIAPQSDIPLQVIMRQCRSSRAKSKFIQSRDIDLLATSAEGHCCVTFKTGNDTYERVWLGLRGRHQIENAAVAIALGETLRESGFKVSREGIILGVGTATYAGRLEMWDREPRVLFDGAHNAAGSRALRDYLDEFIKGPITMIFGAMRDKALQEMASTLFSKVDKLILTQFDNPRAAGLDALKAALPEGFDERGVRLAASAEEALRIALELTPGDGIICVTGSLYLIGVIQQLLSRETTAVVGQSAAH